MLKHAIVLAVVVVLVFIAAPAGAQVDYRWDADNGTAGIQDGGGTWQVGQPNWDDGTPNVNWADGNNALFGGAAGGAAGTVTVSGTVSPNNLTIDPAFGGGNYTIGGGTIDVAFGGGITVNATGTTTISSKVTSTATEDRKSMSVTTGNAGSALTLSGGAGGDPMGWDYGLEHWGPGTLTLSGTSQFGKSDLRNGPGISLGHADPGQGRTLVISGDVTLADQATFGLGRNNIMDITGSLSSSGSQHNNVEGTVNLSGTGRWTFQGTGINWLSDGNDSRGVLNIRDNAVLEVDRTAGDLINVWSPGGLVLCMGWNGAGNLTQATVNQDGGSVNLPVTVAAGLGGGGVVGGQGLIMGGVRSELAPLTGPVVTTYNLNDGTLYTSGVYNLSGLWTGSAIDDLANYNQTATFNFNGGTLKASQDDSTDAAVIAQGNNHFMGNLSHAYVKDGGAIVDTNSFNASIDQALEHDPGASPVDGGLQKLGEGTLTLLKSSTYTGDTSVDAGTLEIMHAYLDDASSVSILSGAMMDLNFTGDDTIAGLTLGGLAKGAGTYDSTSDPLFFTGLGSLLVAGGVAVPGDTNGDGIVNDADLANFEAQFGGAPGAESADFDGDGDVDAHDFATMRGNWGFGVGPAPLSGAATPEPATMTILALGGLLVLRRRRRKA